jgi:hypothetical protein
MKWVAPILTPDGRVFHQSFPIREDAIQARLKFAEDVDKQLDDEARLKAPLRFEVVV